MDELYGQGDTDPTNVAAALGDHIKIDDKKSGRVGLIRIKAFILVISFFLDSCFTSSAALSTVSSSGECAGPALDAAGLE